MSLGFTFIAQHNIIYLHSVGGYECEFVDVPHKDDYCVICLHPARDPQQTKCECAKLYCKSCYDQLRSTQRTCPTCRQPLDAFPDRNGARRVKGMKVKCTSKGCDWMNELGSLESHLETCGFALVPCANGCKEQIMRSEHTSHCTEVCPLRSHTCEHCQSKGTYKKMTGGHLFTCPDLKVLCPNNGCGDSIKRREMASHRLACPYEIIDCPYKDVGCKDTFQRRTKEDHEATSCCRHLDLAVKKLTSLGCDLDQAKVQLKNLATSCKVKLGPQNPCVIKMPAFNKLKRNNRAWYSPGFYTHNGGYKLCLRVCANGDDVGEGTHVSVFLYLMKGENDDTVTWPIKYKCTITLLNQLKDEGHYLDTIDCTTDEADDVNSRVLSGKSSTRGWGIPQFIPHDQLDFGGEACQYLKDDSLYFRVQVEVLPACKPWLMVTDDA